MQGGNQQLNEFFRSAVRFTIPQYQRNYQWQAENWQALIRDIVDIQTMPEMNPTSPGIPISHWMGILLLTRGENIPGDLVQEYIVIDGQQRLVTLRLWLAALQHAAYDRDKEELKLDYPLISVQDSDNSAFLTAIEGQWRSPKSRALLSGKLCGPLGAYAYFRWVLWRGEDELSSESPIKFPKLRKEPRDNESIEDEWTQYCTRKGIARCTRVDFRQLAYTTTKRLSFYYLEHDRSRDESQEIIFDTLNGRQLALQPFEHARNSLFIRIKDKKGIYQTYWKPYEHELTKTTGRGTQFLYDYLISQGEFKRQGTISTRKGAAHLSYMTSSKKGEELDIFVRENMVYALGAWPIVMGYANDFKLEGFQTSLEPQTLQFLQSIREMSVGPATPAALLYISLFLRNEISEKDLRSRLELIEAYIGREILVGAPLSPLRSFFMKFLGEIDKNKDLNLLKDYLAKTWKTDKAIKEVAINRKHEYYQKATSKALGAILRCVERQMAGPGSHWFEQGTTEGKYTVEHIYPQVIDKRWKTDLDLWHQRKDKMDELMHTLGNLTVVTSQHNKTIKNISLKDKQDYVKKAGHAALMWINNSWVNEREWTTDKIKQRTEELINQALKYFKFERD